MMSLCALNIVRSRDTTFVNFSFNRSLVSVANTISRIAQATLSYTSPLFWAPDNILWAFKVKVTQEKLVRMQWACLFVYGFFGFVPSFGVFYGKIKNWYSWGGLGLAFLFSISNFSREWPGGNFSSLLDTEVKLCVFLDLVFLVRELSWASSVLGGFIGCRRKYKPDCSCQSLHVGSLLL